MERTTLISYTFMNGSMHIHPYDTEIHFTDYSTRETISIEGMAPRDVHQAILCYINNLSLQKDNAVESIKWFNELKVYADEALERLK
jgi:hypothetical protein